MAEKSGFFDAHIIGEEYDRVYLAEDFAKYFSSFITNGIFGGKSNELMVRQASPANMTISVSSGHAWINGYKYENTNDLSLAVDVADGVLNRIDAVVLRWGKAERKIWLAIKKGTPAAKPVVPTLQRDSDYYELKLAEISIVAGAVNIVQSNITDTRLFSDVCGYVVGAVQQFDTTYFGAQLNAYVNEYAAEYKKWLNEMEISGADELNEALERLNELIDGDTVGLLTNEIERTKDRVLDIENGEPAQNSYLVNDKIVVLDVYEDAQLSMTSLIDFVQQGAGTASPNNVRHIVGHKTLHLSRHGKNMWTTDAVYPLGNPAGGKLLYDAATQKYTIKANAASYTGNIYKLPVPIPAGVKVTATMFLEKGKLDVGTIVFGGFNDASEQWQCDVRVPEGGILTGRVVTKTLTTALPITHFRAFIYSDNVVTEDIVLRMQFEFGDAATNFELYRGSVFTTAFDNTIYGGEYNWETGKLTVNKTCVTLTGTENVELSEGVYGGHNLFVIRNSTNNVNTLKAAASSHGRQSNTAFELYADVGDFALWVSPERNASWFGILSDASTVDEFKNYLAEQNANGTPYTMVYENYVPTIVQYAGQNIFAIQGKNYISSNTGNTKVLYTHVSKTYVEANFARKSVNGVVQSENADYAEVTEWSDGNPNGEDRVGYFVCVDVDTPGINVRKAGTFDNVRGVTMRNPAFSANCTPDKFDENGNLLPQFNHVGFAGFIPVIDNGTCTIGSYCMPGEDGTAVPSINTHGYQVIERVDENHVLILVEPGADFHVRMQEEIKNNMDYAKRVGNPHNLLDNSDFRNPVNQRGVTNFAGTTLATGALSIDRWLFYGASTNVQITPDGITAVNDGAATFGIAQRILEGVIHAGKIYTLACKAKVTGAAYLSYGKYATAITDRKQLDTGVDKIHTFTFTAEASTDGVYNFRLRTDAEALDVHISWMALYEGEYTAETLPEYQPKGYGVELAECQRYYENSWFGTDKSEDQIYTGVIFNSYSLDARIPFKRHKRVVPTVTFNPKADGSISWRIYNQEAYRDLSSISTARSAVDAIMCRVRKNSDTDTSTWTPNTAATITGHWEASADL